MKRIAFFFFMLLPPALSAATAPELTLETTGGKVVKLPREHEGVDIYLFWATWCPYCQRLMPHLQSIKDEHGGKVSVFAINFRDDGDATGYMEKRGFEFVLLTEGDEAAARYGMHGTPGLVLVDGRGHIQFNLYELADPAEKALDELGHGPRAERLAPWWAAQIRRAIDDLLAD